MNTRPIQNAEKLPATRPESTFSEAPPSREALTTSLTCIDCVEVKTLMNSGINAPASVPQLMISESCHHRSVLPNSTGIMYLETTNVRTIETIEVNHTRTVN